MTRANVPMADESAPIRRNSFDRIQRTETENTPLLYNGHALSNGTVERERREDNSVEEYSEVIAGKPLPLVQIFLLCYARMMEPIAFVSIFPYIAQMVQRNGQLEESDVGFYSGLIESLFSATQMVTLIFWGRLADKIGRKPTLIYSLIGMAIGPALFGMASSLWQMILFRCLAGVFSGPTLVIRTMISDHCTPHTQARAFSWFAFAGNVGIFLGPLIGGALADPAHQYPGAFKDSVFFKSYPYSLPGFTIAAISITGVLTSAFFLEETLGNDASKAAQEPNNNRTAGAAETDTGEERMRIIQILKRPGIPIVIWVYSHIMLLTFAFTALLPLYLYTAPNLGGLGFSAPQISMFLAAQGASQALWLLLAFPWLQNRFGTKKVLLICTFMNPFFAIGYILVNLLLRIGTPAAISWFWIVGTIVVLTQPSASMAATGCQLLLNDAAPNAHVLGVLNSVALTAASGIRSFIPALTTALFAIGVKNSVLSGHFVWAIFITLAGLLFFAVMNLPEDPPPQKLNTTEE